MSTNILIQSNIWISNIVIIQLIQIVQGALIFLMLCFLNLKKIQNFNDLGAKKDPILYLVTFEITIIKKNSSRKCNTKQLMHLTPFKST